MALIKSSQLIQKGTAVVAGDSIQTADLETVIPQAPDPAPPAPVDQGPIGLGVDMGHPVDPDAPYELETTVPLEGEGEPGWADPDPDAPPEEGATIPDPEPTSSLLSEYDAERDAILATAEASAQAAYEEAQVSYDHDLAETVDAQMREAQSVVGAVYEPGSPEAETAMRTVTPHVERSAQASAHRNAVFEVNRNRWLQVATAEEQIAALLDNFHARLVDDPPHADQLVALLAEREAILSEARMQAEQILQGAQAQAAAIVQEAESSAARTVLEVETRRQQILDELKQQGYSEGYQEGRAQADEEGAKIINEATESLNQMAGALRESAKENEEKLLKLAIGIAEKILHDEIAVRPETVLRNLEEAIAKVSDLEEVIIKVNPEDLAMVQTQEDAFRDRLKSVRKVEFTSSPKIQKGGVLIETGSGTVDAQIKTQLSVIYEAFDFVRKEYAEEPLDMTGSG